jgi:hypothetical protein
VAWAALAVVAVEALVALAFGPQRLLALCLLVLAPGLALTPFLPRELALPAIRVAVAPILGAAASSVAMVSAAAFGIPLTGLSVRLIVLFVVLASVAASIVFGPRLALDVPDTSAAESPSEGVTLALLGAAVAVGVALQGLIVGGKPLPGQDWGHYLLYVDEIRKQGSLLIDNPFWMLGGLPFPNDPGAPALYAAQALLSEQATASLLQGIWLVAVLGIISVFVFVAALWGRTAGLIAAGLYAVVPMNLDMLAWHGLANMWALVLLPAVLLAIGMALRGDLDLRWCAFLALFLVALAAAHRLTFLVAALTLLPCVVVLIWRHGREGLRFAAWTLAFAVVGGAGVIADVVQRNIDTGGVQGYRAFLATKVDWDFVGRDLTWLLAVLGALALLVLLTARALRGDNARFVLFGLLAAVLALSYAWVVHVPLSYNRATFYLPLLLAAAIGVAWAKAVPRLALGAVVVILLVGLEARDLAQPLRTFYGYTNQESLTGLGYLKGLSKPDDVVVTDTCWGFLSTWLLAQPILAAQDPSLILPQAEVAPANTARRILYGGKQGARLARRIGARFAIVDPQCTHQTGRLVAEPDIGTPIYASTRLLVLDLRRST